MRESEPSITDDLINLSKVAGRDAGPGVASAEQVRYSEALREFLTKLTAIKSNFSDTIQQLRGKFVIEKKKKKAQQEFREGIQIEAKEIRSEKKAQLIPNDEGNLRVHYSDLQEGTEISYNDMDYFLGLLDVLPIQIAEKQSSTIMTDVGREADRQEIEKDIIELENFLSFVRNHFSGPKK